MKLAKRIIATICSLAMVASLSTVSVFAEETAENTTKEIKVIPILTETAEGSGIYDLDIQLDISKASKGKKIGLFQFRIPLDPEVFDLENGPLYTESVWSDDAFDYVETYPNIEYKVPKFSSGEVKYVYDDITTINDDNTLRYTFNAGTTYQNLPMQYSIVKFKNLKLLDDVETDDITITLNGVEAKVGSDPNNSNDYKASADQIYVGTATFPGNKTDDGGDDEGDTNAPVQVGGGVIEDTVEDSKDAAVAYTQKFTAVEGYKVRWNLTCNKVGEPDKMINGSYTYTIANIETEGDVNIGLIVQYDPSVYENVVVTDGAIVTE